MAEQNLNLEKLNSTQQNAARMAQKLLENIKWALQVEWTKQYAFFTGYIVPAANAFLINFWSNALSIVMPYTMATLGDRKAFQVISKL